MKDSAKKQVLTERSLAETSPELVRLWHPSKNKGLTTKDVVCRSSKKVWWQCELGHSWQAQINSVDNSTRSGCPFCAGKRVFKENSLKFNFPKIAKEWHKEKNGNLTPADITCYSNKKVWWQCKIAPSHVYETAVNNRTRLGSGCPYCAGKKVSADNNLAVRFPEIAALWHPRKNSKLTPFDVTAFSTKRVWWKCGVAKDHEWQSTVASQSTHKGCPFCAGFRLTHSTSLLGLNPGLAASWNYEKNGARGPADILAGSHEKVWWVCLQGHEWQAAVSSRASNSCGCPYCAGQKVCSDNSFATLYPDYALQWHPTKNGDKKPSDFTKGSEYKAWWQCAVSVHHVWQVSINNRTNGNKGCPFCVGKKVAIDNCLQTVLPLVAQQWHPTKNGKLTPFDVTPQSSKKVWWKCYEGHVWRTSVSQVSNARIERLTTGCLKCYLLEKGASSAKTLKGRAKASRRAFIEEKKLEKEAEVPRKRTDLI